MPAQLYHSIVSKIAMRVPMFAKAIVDRALAQVGATPYDVTPRQMRRAIEEHITPSLGTFLKPAERVAHLGCGILAIDAEDRLLQASPAALFLLDLRARGLSDRELVAHAKELGVLVSTREMTAGGEDVLVREVKLPGGRSVESAMQLLRERSGQPLGLVVLLQDVTLSAYLEEEVDNLFAELESKNQSLGRSEEKLQYYVSELEEATRVKSRLLANVSHELRTPLNAIIGFTDSVLAGMDGPVNEAQRESLGIVASSSRQLLALIDDLLDLSRMEAGKLALTREEVDIGALVTSVVSTMSILARERGLTLEGQIARGIPLIATDGTRVRQILLNLISNAIKHTHDGGIRVTAARTPSDHVQVQVIDTGRGIPPHELENIWQEFHQVTVGSPHFAGGSGLGLSISRRYAQLLSGSLTVESSLGRGSTFTLVLPRRV